MRTSQSCTAGSHWAHTWNLSLCVLSLCKCCCHTREGCDSDSVCASHLLCCACCSSGWTAVAWPDKRSPPPQGQADGPLAVLSVTNDVLIKQPVYWGILSAQRTSWQKWLNLCHSGSEPIRGGAPCWVLPLQGALPWCHSINRESGSLALGWYIKWGEMWWSGVHLYF